MESSVFRIRSQKEEEQEEEALQNLGNALKVQGH